MKGNILIIDDEHELVKNLQHILAKYADTIYTASNGADGLRIIQNKNIHCVISDIYMPGMTGIDVIKTVRESGNNVPFIFFTAYGIDEIKTKATGYPKTVFLIKPDIKSITLIISKMLRWGFEGQIPEIFPPAL